MSETPPTGIYGEGAPLLGTENPLNDPVLAAKNRVLRNHLDQSQTSNTQDGEKRLVVDVVATWNEILNQLETLNVSDLKTGDVIELSISVGGSRHLHQLKVVEEFSPDIVRPSNFSGGKAIRLQLIDREHKSKPILGIYGNSVEPGEEVSLTGSSFGGSSVHVNAIDLGTFLVLRKDDGNEVYSHRVSQFKVLRPNKDDVLDLVDTLELMGLTSQESPREVSQEFSEMYKLFKLLETTFTPEEESDYSVSGNWKFDDLRQNRTIEYTTYGSPDDPKDKLAQKITIMDKNRRIMYEIHKVHHLQGSGKRSFQVRAFLEISNTSLLNEFDNCLHELGVNYSNDPKLDGTSYYNSRENGPKGNYMAVVDSNKQLTSGQSESYLPYEQTRTAYLNDHGYIEVHLNGGETVSLELLSTQNIKQIALDAVKVMESTVKRRQRITRIFKTIQNLLTGLGFSRK